MSEKKERLEIKLRDYSCQALSFQNLHDKLRTYIIDKCILYTYRYIFELLDFLEQIRK